MAQTSNQTAAPPPTLSRPAPPPAAHLGLTQPQLYVLHRSAQLPGLLMHQPLLMASLLQTLDGLGQALQHSLVLTAQGLQALGHKSGASQDLLLAESVPSRLIPWP